MYDIVSRMGAWSHDRSSYLMLGTANSLAAADAVSSGNYNIAAFVATATVAATGLVGVTKYVIENLGPVYTKYRVDRNNALSSTVVGQLTFIQGQNSLLQQQSEANADLAKTYQNSLQEERKRREEDSLSRSQKMDDLNHSLAIAREQLTNLTQAAQAALLKAEIADKNEKIAQDDRRSMAAQLEQVKIQLNEAREQLEKSSVPISQTNETVHEIAENVQVLVSEPMKETPKGDMS